MDQEKLSAACAAIEAFFTEEEKARMEDSDWRCEGQTFYERVEGYVLGVIETLEDEMENPDPPDEEDDESADEDVIILSEDEFEKLYPIIENHLNPSAGWPFGNSRGCLFETFGDELEFVKRQDPNKVWTLVDDDEGSCIISGFHVVNRSGYLISTVPVGPGVNVEVQFEANEPDDEEECDDDESEGHCPLD